MPSGIRVPDNNLLSARRVPDNNLLYGLLKDHKLKGSYDLELGPSYQPLFGGLLGPNASLSDLLSEIVDVVANEIMENASN